MAWPDDELLIVEEDELQSHPLFPGMQTCKHKYETESVPDLQNASEGGQNP